MIKSVTDIRHAPARKVSQQEDKLRDMMDLQDRCHLANDLGKFHHDLTVLPNPGNHGLF